MPTLTDIDPSDPNFAQLVEQRLIEFEEEYSIEKYPVKFHSRIGASSIADDCWRKLWYQFRWFKLINPEGRMRRLWQRGNDEEKKFEDFLLWAGFTIKSIDPETKNQYGFSKIDDHYAGRTDGLLLIKWANNYPIIGEYKTFAHDYFQDLKKKKLKISNPKYYAQICNYGREWKVKHGLFYAVNKDNDEWYREFIELDWNYALELEKKAADIIYAKFPPDKINNNPAFYKCKMCDFQGICHYNQSIEKNCRSCSNASPGPNASWLCNKFGTIPKDFLAKGCEDWKGIV